MGAAETWIRRLASHSVPLHAATGLSAHPEVAHLRAEPSICDRCDRFRRSRSAIRRRPRMDHASWSGRHQGAGWHPLRAYRAIVNLAPLVAISLLQTCRSARRPKALRARLLRGPPAQSGTHWTWPVDDFRRIAQGHHRDTSCLAFANCTRSAAMRAEPSGPQFLYGDCTVRLPRTIRNLQKFAPKSKDLQKPVATWRSLCDSATADKVMRNDTAIQQWYLRQNPYNNVR
jgi:hypothetical protein